MSTELTDNKKKLVDDHELEGYDLDFSECDTRYLTHGIHPYPARMPPQIPKVILNHYLRKGDIQQDDTVWDPFAGSGTTGLESQLAGLNSILTDLNPLANLISKTKTTPVNSDEIYQAWKDFALGNLPTIEGKIAVVLSEISESYESGEEIPVNRPEVSSRYEWFPKPQLYHLAHIRERIDILEKEYGEAIARIFRVALARVSRETSYQRNGEYKRYRIPESERDNHNPEVLSQFTKRTVEITDRVEQYSQVIDDQRTVEAFLEDSRFAGSLEENSADIVVTSPPYGDHKTTVAYGQFSLDPAVISMDIDRTRMKAVDKRGLGGQEKSVEPLSDLRTRSQTLDKTIDSLEMEDGRSEDALSFFEDYFEVLQQVRRVLSPGQPAVFVVANRRMSGIQIPTHKITVELLENLGFSRKAIIPRTLPYKTLPYANSPSNVPGETGEMMSDENLVIVRNKE